MAGAKGVSADERLAWLGLALIHGLPSRMALALGAEAGSALGALDIPRERLARCGVGSATVEAWPDAWQRAVAEHRTAEAHGGTVVSWVDASYPSRLREIADPPLVLFVRGRVACLERAAVAIVGARRATDYGRAVAETMARDLAMAGLVVTSGLAAGVDAAAHVGALAGGGETVAVLGTGIDRVYPPWHAKIARAVEENGALVSEFPVGTPPLAWNFPRRNRIVSGLTLGTVVVEGSPRSGSLITARCALEQNRQVFAVPGQVGQAPHDGPHALIRDGAVLVRGAEDVLEELAPQLAPRLATAREAAASRSLSDEERVVMDALRHDSCQLERLIDQTRLGPSRLAEVLLGLEMLGLVEQTAGKRYRRRAA